MIVISNSLISICQLLDITINKLFKNNLCKEWHFYIVKDDAKVTPTRNLYHTKLSDICEWIKNTWKEISNKMIIKSFKTYKISISLNRSDNEITNNIKQLK